MLEKAHHVLSLERSLLLDHQQLALQGDAAHHREVIARELFAQDGCLADRSVGTHHRRQQVEARLVHKQDGPALLYGHLLREGQRSSFQRSIASSSRSDSLDARASANSTSTS